VGPPPWRGVDVSFEQWVLFLAVRFRHHYRAVGKAQAPEDHAALPLARGGKLTVVQVNSGEAVHFLFQATPAAEATTCRALTVEPPTGIALQDWALLHAEGYKRFVERSVPGPVEGHVVVFPGDDDALALLVEEATRLAKVHAAVLGSPARAPG
jgi:hypothetical protein